MDPNNSIADPTRPETRLSPPRGNALNGRLMLSAIVVLFSIVLVILFVHLSVRCHVYRRRRRNRRRRLLFGVPSASSAADAPRGLDPAVLSSLSVQIYADDAAADVAECAVCLCDFEEGEKVRVLPRCGHCFHVGCIDMWFGSHNSCPLCRCAVEIESPAAAEEGATGRQCSDPDRSIGSSSSASPEVSIETDGNEEELGLGFGFEGRDKNWILAIARFLSRDLRSSRGELDLERGESAPPLPAAAAAAE